ncbi:MAG: hypothetical protein ACRDY2_08095 [Acidimicrobiales bacterium]
MASASIATCLLLGHELLVCFVTVAEVRTFLRMGVLAEERARGLRVGLADYALLSVPLDDVITEWVRLRAATVQAGTADDRERRQNDTWIAACALAVEPPLPVVTGNLRDFTTLPAFPRCSSSIPTCSAASSGGRVAAVGTPVARALESAYHRLANTQPFRRVCGRYISRGGYSPAARPVGRPTGSTDSGGPAPAMMVGADPYVIMSL